MLYLKSLFLLFLLSFQNLIAKNNLNFEDSKYQKKTLTIESLPENLTPNLSVAITYLGEVLTLELERSSVYGSNTRILVDNGTGKLIEVEKTEECTYIGHVKEHLGYYVNAVITPKGLIATIIKSRAEKIEIRPLLEDKKTHEIFTIKTENPHTYKVLKREYPNSVAQNENFSADLFSNNLKKKILEKKAKTQGATLDPTTVMDVLEYEIGVEIGSRSFLAEAYNGDLAIAQASAQSIIGNLNRRYLPGAGVKFTLGTVIIRTNASTDPLRDLVTGTGTASTANSSLAAFKDYWNNNPDEVGTTHDIAVYHVKSAPSGLAYVNNVGTSQRYGTMGGNGATSWADGTAVHEVGHIWNLRHTSSSGIFYENRPRVDAGATSSGGRDYFISVMHGSGNHNIGRFSTEEAQVVREVLNRKRAIGNSPSNLGEIKPFGVYDRFFMESNVPITIDVVSNDYDVNNDVLDVRILDQVSNLGGTISLSTGTGPGGRNELIYTPPVSGLNGEDFFHYTVFDTSGLTDFGAVYVTREASLFDENSDEFRFDLGTKTSELWPNYDRVHATTSNDLYGWVDSTNLSDRDRGTGGGANNLNRDLCHSSEPATFETKVQNGKWQVLITFGDIFVHDNIFVKAEGVDKVLGVDITPNIYFNEKFEVDVADGKLSLEFSDRGGSDINWVANRILLTKLGALSVEENNIEDAFYVYPNPTNSVLNIKINGNRSVSLSIVDVLGNVVYQKKELENMETAIDVSHWAKGTYFITYKRSAIEITKKIIIH